MKSITHKFLVIFFLFIFLFQEKIKADDISDSDIANRIIMESLSPFLGVNETMSEIVGFTEKEWSLRKKEYENCRELTKALPINQKCRIMLLNLILFDFDGENAELLHLQLGDDVLEVGKKLSEISDDDFKQACRNVGVPESRSIMFRKLVTIWAKG